MPHLDGAHTHGPGGGGVVVVAVIAAAVLIGSGAASAIASVLVTILIIAAAVIALAVAAVVALLVHRTRQDRRRPPIATRAVHQLPPEVRPHLEKNKDQVLLHPRAAIEPPREIHLHFHGTDPADVAGLIHRIDRSNP